MPILVVILYLLGETSGEESGIILAERVGDKGTTVTFVLGNVASCNSFAAPAFGKRA